VGGEERERKREREREREREIDIYIDIYIRKPSMRLNQWPAPTRQYIYIYIVSGTNEECDRSSVEG